MPLKQGDKDRRELVKNTTVKGRLRAVLDNARTRSKVKNWPFDLTLEFLCGMYEDQCGLCALTGKVLELKADKKVRSSNLVSLDRLDNKKGYTKDNVWLVTSRANYSRGPMSVTEYIELCSNVVQRLGK
ncbi:hypothetical protein UFOVP343_14 [uncultured Caudovirales phage]|uniref:Uncharacterized protein n=1 Tax=uncultured Caudovirales phage TaxID=2100421 RepID=A0A6J5LXM4_9CAUD|nr:hypothetical protein UFOVP343_14 [uncultured Caudovirales phage]